ncbi:MAG TPA: apolipoprotein N-acyltransferase, partial [Patescibacteria group bacterium]|nr:apolipoprotein N-acyltransferase [Patescibacteria group bacterium]
LYWIAYALLIDPLKFGWLIPFAVFGLGGVLACFSGVAALAARRLMPPGVARVLVFAVAWTVLEWVRSWIFTGFSWNLLGTVWMPVLPVVQFASVFGAYGLGLLTVVVAALPAVLVQPSRRHIVAVAVSLLSLLVIAAWGAWRLPAGPVPSVPGVKLRLVQGNVTQTAKWRPEMREQHLRDYLRLTMLPGHDQVTAVVWPETAVPYFLEDEPVVRQLIAAVTPPGGVVITGAVRGTPPGVPPFQIWNSLEAVNAEGAIIATYDKVHLVPFGEYVPLRGILPLSKITPGGVDFTAGVGLRTLALPGLPAVGPTICYEDIFPAQVAAADPRPSWLLNITNDGWFGISAGPYQHFAAARLRAVEEGLPMIRDANTGVTGVVDPYGRVVAELVLGRQGILDSELPRPLSTPNPFAQWGGAMVCLLLMLVSLSALIWHRLFDRDRARVAINALASK